MKYNLCGLKLYIREMVAQRLRIIPLVYRTNLITVKLFMVDIGNSKRAMLWERKTVVIPKVPEPYKETYRPGDLDFW